MNEEAGEEGAKQLRTTPKCRLRAQSSPTTQMAAESRG